MTFITATTSTNVCNHTNVEQVWCSLTIRCLNQPPMPRPITILLGCIYRPEDMKASNNTKESDTQDRSEAKKLMDKTIKEERDKAINEIIEKLGEKAKDYSGIILAGDFNFHDIQWEYYENKIVPINGKSEEAKLFISAVEKSGLNQHINFKTYIKTLKCDTLDLVFTDNDHKVIDVMPEPFLGNSILAHIGISWKYIIPNAKVEREQLSEVWITNDLQKRLKKHDFYKAYEQLCQDFSNSMYST